MSKLLVLYTDGDTAVYHPVAKEKLDDYGTEKYLFNLTDDNKDEIISYLLENSFKFNEKFYDILLAVMDDVVNMIVEKVGVIDFYNYNIKVIDKLPIVEL